MRQLRDGLRKLSPGWRLFLFVAFVCGLALRMAWTEDMEWKEDEQYNFTQSQAVGRTQPWPWVGMPSGVFVPNPGMSVWVFAALARIAGATTPTALANAVQAFALLGIALVLPFALWLVRTDREREPWLWSFALAMVNPFAILYQRKLWPEPFMPFFSMLALMGWWKRDRAAGAFAWGLVGALIGQIHMSGFFFAAGLALWTLVFDRRHLAESPRVGRSQVRWGSWFLGSCLGALPLLPWLAHVLSHPVREQVTSGLGEALQLKYWVFWVTDPLGLTLGNPVGLLRSRSNLGQIADLARYPLVAGHATYLVGVAHAVALAASCAILWRGLRFLWGERKLLDRAIGRSSETAFVVASALWGCGALLTASLVRIRRYYMMTTFPLEFVWLSRLALGDGRQPERSRRLLAALWIAQLVISAGFVWYVHVNQGAVQGDYGEAYHVIEGRKARGNQAH